VSVTLLLKLKPSCMKVAIINRDNMSVESSMIYDDLKNVCFLKYAVKK
jgi:hypothetical protein